MLISSKLTKQKHLRRNRKIVLGHEQLWKFGNILQLHILPFNATEHIII